MKLGHNIVTLLIMIFAQFCGALFGVLLGYLAIIDKNDEGRYNYDYSIPKDWVRKIAPKLPNN